MFGTFIYNPLYNGLITLVGLVPGGDAGIAAILFTVIVRFVLYPLSKSAIRTQEGMKRIKPELEELKEKYKDNPQEQATEMFALYKREQINPFASIFLILIQLPIIFALYFVFLRGGLPEINMDILYSFVTIPENVSMMFLGFVDMTKRSAVLALLAGITQHIHARKTFNTPAKRDGSFGGDFAHTMQIQMKYGMPVLITIIAFTLPAIISLYWVTSNIFTLIQETSIRRGLTTENEE